MLGDRQRPSESFLDPGLETSIADVGPHERDGGEQEVEEAEREHAARLVMDVGRVNLGIPPRRTWKLASTIRRRL
jgi:hypothetical protein